MPLIFIGHGSPLNILMDNSFTKSLIEIAHKLPRPKGVLVISAHWLTSGTFVNPGENPQQNYDFYGFPDELYTVRYGCKGSWALAHRVIESVKSIKILPDESWGIDHGSWGVLKHMYPQADVPVFQLSIDYSKDEEYHFRLASELAPLRREGLLIIGSGNIVHNLRMADFYNMDAEPYEWALKFDEFVKGCLLTGDHDKLTGYRDMGTAASLSVPTNDHYLPLMYVIGLMEKDEKIRFTHAGFQNKSVSMRCFVVGENFEAG